MTEVVIGIDIGGTFTKFGIVDKNGNCLAENFTSTDKFIDFEVYLEHLHTEIEELLNTITTEIKIKGIGIGAPNGNYYHGTIEHAPNLNWKGIVPFIENFKPYFPGIPMVLTNDANAAAIGEMIYGGAKDIKDFIVITLGTGLGSGIVVNGELVYGHDGFAGELGHINVKHRGRKCGCGKSGCLETYVSATGIKRTVFKLLAERVDKTELRDISYNDLTAKMVSEAAKKGDKIALEAFEITGRILGVKLADAVACTSPKAIFVFGGLAKAGDLIFNPTQKYMEENLFPIYRGKVKLLPSQLQETNAAVLGASALAWKELEK
ncbi:MAG: ROK family protein [Bacteroidales bacterium]|nr:ROK family protein [Bacteroidales bacterium]MBN2820809.1 ROK family protein [Bacteroidales bacterium]